ncbi:MAG TPA: hypothetical protein VEK56_08985 [Vicinamibacterales bacterium]|nr:hypothetical protein [Vicinamibacterales bacterium]
MRLQTKFNLGFVILMIVASAQTAGSQATVKKGGDERTGEYDAVANWWNPAPEQMRRGRGARYRAWR